MRITESDVRVKLDYLNELLTAINSPFRLNFSFRYNYYVLEEVNASDNLPTATYNYCAGTKRECYDYLCAMLRGIDIYSFRKE